MSKSELFELEKHMRSLPPAHSLSLEQLRAAIDSLGDQMALDPSVAIEAAVIARIPVEVGCAPETSPERTLIYLHGGGATGSLVSHRGLVSKLGRAADARTIAINYRLPPDHPFPAGAEDAVAVYRALLDGGTSPDT